MFVYLLQLREAGQGRPAALVFFPVLATVVWVTWALKTVLSRRYRPWTDRYDVTTTVVVPVVDEPVDLFRDVLLRILKQDPDQVVVVINGPANPPLAQICDDLGIAWTWTDVPGKRNAIRLGVAAAHGDIVVLVDSDTIWTDTTLEELVKPFADPGIGGVTTRQRVANPHGFLQRWADWLENSRALYSMPAQSVLGHVGCLPGRTIAFRRHILRQVMDDFLTARFLGVFLEVSDDRTLTNLTLKAGYRTVYQSTSLVYTDAPSRLPKMWRQQLRWARGSQYNTLRMLPWMVMHTPVLAFFFVVDIATSFLFAGCIISWVWHTTTHTGHNSLTAILDWLPGPTGWAAAIGAVLAGSVLSMWLRQWRHLVTRPADFGWMPAYILFSSFFLIPVRLYGFVRMAHAAGWGTRTGAYQATRHRNPGVMVPYLIAGLIVALEVTVVATTS